MPRVLLVLYRDRVAFLTGPDLNALCDAMALPDSPRWWLWSRRLFRLLGSCEAVRIDGHTWVIGAFVHGETEWFGVPYGER